LDAPSRFCDKTSDLINRGSRATGPDGISSKVTDRADSFGTEPDDLTVLLLRCFDGDRASLREIYDRQAPRLRALAIRITGDGMLADDVLHDVFVRLMVAPHRFDRERGSAAAFLTMVTRFAAMETMRGRRREPVMGGQAGQAEDEAATTLATLRANDRRPLAECLERLEPRTRRMILLAFGEGYSHAELSKRFAMPLGTAKSLLRRGLLALRRCLDQ
jgi:RNA polymerase sigma-70 factor (ECF subfamily)